MTTRDSVGDPGLTAQSNYRIHTGRFARYAGNRITIPLTPAEAEADSRHITIGRRVEQLLADPATLTIDQADFLERIVSSAEHPSNSVGIDIEGDDAA